MTELIYTLIVTHITIVCVTLYLHRGQAHRGIIFHPILEHFMRFWLWLTTGMVTKEWVAIHRAHHRYCEESKDPHSPHVFGIWRVLFGGAFLYAQAKQDRVMIEQYGVGTPNDRVEKLYSGYPWLGITLLLLVNLLWFSWWGLLIWLVQMIWVPFHAAGVINGLAHWWGYRNTETKDRSHNLIPCAIWIGGEELHNNHHAEPSNVKLSRKWFEFDIGWMWLTIMRMLHLAKLKKA